MTRDKSTEDPSREDAREEREACPARAQGAGSDADREQLETRSRENERIFEHDLRVVIRNRTYQLTAAEATTVYAVGQFRAIEERDLETYRVTGPEHPNAVLDTLTRKKLIKSRSITAPGKNEPIRVVMLTTLGRDVLQRACGPQCEQRFYAGLVKLRELRHDTALYRVYQAESERLRAKGCTIRRVVLDHELKRKLFSDLERQRRQGTQGSDLELKRQIATRYCLHVVNGRVALPDLRIEYETAERHLDHIDLELTTGHYKAAQRAEKVRAGFQIYSLESHAGGTPRREDILQEIFSR